MTSAIIDRDNSLAITVQRLLAYCQTNDWAGYEPYDALNSRLLSALPVLDFKLARLAITQALKRSPLNLRRLLLIPQSQNPKAIGLFLSSFVKLARAGMSEVEVFIPEMIERLVALRSQDTSHWCWGYNFPWQTRFVLVPRWAPNLVCTAFAADALLDAYEHNGDSRLLAMADSAAEYILGTLYWSEGPSRCGFGYPLPEVRNQVHNANLLAAALFCRLYRHTGKTQFFAPALKAVRYTVSRQNFDGGWYYGEADSQRWIDNFHTGFNLNALRSIARSLETTEFDSSLRRGFEFYRAHFFCPDGSVKYYHNRKYPLDSHCVAQSILTLMELRDLAADNVPLACSVYSWAMKNLWDERGFFYYRKLRSCVIRTSYMRWTQAWMLLGLSSLLCEGAVPMSRPAHAVTVEA